MATSTILAAVLGGLLLLVLALIYRTGARARHGVRRRQLVGGDSSYLAPYAGDAGCSNSSSDGGGCDGGGGGD